VAVAFGLVLLGVLVASYVFFTRRIWFFRDPSHGDVPQDSRQVLSPVYGIVSYIKRVHDGVVMSEKHGEPIVLQEITRERIPFQTGWLVGIAMTALDVHYQYAPIPGEVVRICHVPARVNFPMFDLWEYVRITWFRRSVDLFARKHLLMNERQTFFLENSSVQLVLILIADKFVNKIRTFVREGERVSAGSKLSFIGRGSQVDVFIPYEAVRWCVRPGERVCGPLTVLARVEDSREGTPL
jgi:phosphatidylserine decarboxylase